MQVLTAIFVPSPYKDTLLNSQAQMGMSILGGLLTFAGYLINTLVKKEEEQVNAMQDKDDEIESLKTELDEFRCEFRDHEESNGNIKKMIQQRTSMKKPQKKPLEGQLTRTTESHIKPYPEPAEGVILPPKEEVDE